MPMSSEVGRANFPDKYEDALVPRRPPVLGSGRPQSARGRPRPVSAGPGRVASGDPFAAFASGNRPPRPQSASSQGRRILPAELGLAGARVLALPSHLDTCDQGEKCCWRWLAHAVLKEASWLKEDLDALRREHEQYVGEKTKTEHDIEAFAELRGTHAATQRELNEMRTEASEVRRELAAIRTAHAHKAAREQELERELARVTEERRSFMEQEVVASRRADEADRELERAKLREQDLEKKLLSSKDSETLTHADVKELRADRDRLRKALEDEESKRQNRRGKRGLGRGGGQAGTRLIGSSAPGARAASAGSARR